MQITWDEPKRLANLVKHGLDFAAFETAFDFDRFGILPANPGRDGRPRMMFVGEWNGEIVVAAVVSPLGSEALSLVSLRHASKKERETYDRL